MPTEDITPVHVSSLLQGTLHEISHAALSLSGAVMGDIAGQIYPTLQTTADEVAKLAGLAVEQAKEIASNQASV